MRTWMAYIIAQQNLAEDFVDHMHECRNNLLSLENKAILENDMEGAKYIAHEIKVYDKLRSLVEKELKEQRAQFARENET